MFTQIHLTKKIFLWLLFISPTLLFSQDNSLHFKRGRLFTTEGYEVKFRNLNQQKNTFTVETSRGKFRTYDKNEILRIEKQTGSEALEWGGYFATVTFVEAFLYLHLTEDTFPREDRKQFNKRVLIGTTAIGAVVGMLIGSYKGKYRKVYDDPAFRSDVPKLGLNFTAPNQVSSLTLSYHF